MNIFVTKGVDEEVGSKIEATLSSDQEMVTVTTTVPGIEDSDAEEGTSEIELNCQGI